MNNPHVALASNSGWSVQYILLPAVSRHIWMEKLSMCAIKVKELLLKNIYIIDTDVHKM